MLTLVRFPTLQEIVDHLNALTTASLPLALQHWHVHSCLSGDTWQGPGLLFGSRLSNIIQTLAVFGIRYAEGRWTDILQAAIPGCTVTDIQWLVSLPAPVDSPLPAPQSQNKRKASSLGGLDNGTRRRAPQSAPVRRSPRSHHASTAPVAALGTYRGPITISRLSSSTQATSLAGL